MPDTVPHPDPSLSPAERVARTAELQAQLLAEHLRELTARVGALERAVDALSQWVREQLGAR